MQDVSVGKATSAVILAIVVAALAVPVAQAKPGPIFGVGDNMSTYSAAAKAKAHTAKPQPVYGIGDNMSVVAPANRARAEAQAAKARQRLSVALTFYARRWLKPSVAPKAKAKPSGASTPYDSSDVISRLLARLGHARPNDRPVGALLWDQRLIIR